MQYRNPKRKIQTHISNKNTRSLEEEKAHEQYPKIEIQNSRSKIETPKKHDANTQDPKMRSKARDPKRMIQKKINQTKQNLNNTIQQ